MGFLVLVVGLAVLGFGVWNHFKGTRILAAPFKKTGELAADPSTSDPKGAISTQGQVVPPGEALLSPCSKTPCLYYEVKVERIYEKTETTQDGTKTTTSTDTLDTVTGGTTASLDDGSGAFQVDFSKGGDFDNLKEGFKKELNGRGWASNVTFGEFSYDIPVLGSKDGHTIGFKATEKFVPVDGNLFVLGKLDGGKIVKPSWRSLLVSNKGREGLLGSVNKKKKFSFIGGGVATVLSIPLMIWGPSVSSGSCQTNLMDAQAKCSSNVSDKDGDEYTWKVTKPGTYALTVFAPAKKVQFDPELIITNADGEQLADERGGIGGDAKATVDVEAGEYTLTVKPGDGYMVKGGFSYSMEILGGAAAPVGKGMAKADAEPGDDDAAPADQPSEKVVIQAPALAAEFLKSSAKATAAYDNKLVEVTGVLKEVDTDPSSTIVRFEVPEVEGKFDRMTALINSKTTLKKGQVVTVRGTASVLDMGGVVVTMMDAELISTGAAMAKAPSAKTPVAAPKAHGKKKTSR